MTSCVERDRRPTKAQEETGRQPDEEGPNEGKGRKKKETHTRVHTRRRRATMTNEAIACSSLHAIFYDPKSTSSR